MIVGEATDIIIIPIMVFVQGITILIHVISIIFKLVIAPVPALPTLVAAAIPEGAIRTITTFLAGCADRHASAASFFTWKMRLCRCGHYGSHGRGGLGRILRGCLCCRFRLSGRFHRCCGCRLLRGGIHRSCSCWLISGGGLLTGAPALARIHASLIHGRVNCWAQVNASIERASGTHNGWSSGWFHRSCSGWRLGGSWLLVGASALARTHAGFVHCLVICGTQVDASLERASRTNRGRNSGRRLWHSGGLLWSRGWFHRCSCRWVIFRAPAMARTYAILVKRDIINGA